MRFNKRWHCWIAVILGSACPACAGSVDSGSCGNGVIQPGETCDPPDTCPTSCDDENPCTGDERIGNAADCNVTCWHYTITTCGGGDACCPASCNSHTDPDCSALCGNGFVDPLETCDPPDTCPTACSDGDPCTEDALVGSAANCNVTCWHYPISTCLGGDGCCPSGCISGDDADCSALCGNGFVDPSETCDPPETCPTTCSDGDLCTKDELVGSAANCNARCSYTAITQCQGGDGCCPSGCISGNDADCSALCGNGFVDPSETCDPPATCPTTCNDGDLCTTDELVGSAANCDASCRYSAISLCQAGDGCCPVGCNGGNDSDCVLDHQLRAMVVVVDPRFEGQSIYAQHFAWLNNGQPLDEAVAASAAGNVNAFLGMTENQVQYRVVNTKLIETFPPRNDGTRFTFDSYVGCVDGSTAAFCEQQKWIVDYPGFFLENNLCQEANQVAADELWIVSPPFALTFESFMVGPTEGYDVNGPTFILPACSKLIAGVTIGYTPQPSTHISGHRFERSMDFITSTWTSSEAERHWRIFSGVSRYQETMNEPHPVPYVYCGNAHFPHNASMHYDYWNKTILPASCPDWRNFPNYLGATLVVNCDYWNCNPDTYDAFWMGSMPRDLGTATIQLARGGTAEFPKDWWSLILYPAAAIQWVNSTR